MTVDAVGGIWTYALDLAAGLASRGIDTVFAVLGPRPSLAQCSDAAQVPGLAVRYIDQPLDWTARTAGEVAAAGDAVAALARSEDVDLVQLNSPALAADTNFDIPLVGVCHSCVVTWWHTVRGATTPLPPDFEWRRRLLADGYARLGMLVAPSAAFARMTAEIYRLRMPPMVVHNGRSPSAVCEEERQADYVFTAGRLWDEGKNLAALDAAAAHSHVKVFAAGPREGPNGAAITLRHIRHLGQLGTGAIADWLEPAPVFVSLALYEPFGLAVLEAAQAGCPLVLSDIPTFRELWNGAAVFVPVEATCIAVADVIQGLMMDGERRKALRAVARECSRRYSVEAMTLGMIDVYEKALEAHDHLRRPA